MPPRDPPALRSPAGEQEEQVIKRAVPALALGKRHTAKIIQDLPPVGRRAGRAQARLAEGTVPPLRYGMLRDSAAHTPGRPSMKRPDRGWVGRGDADARA